VVIGIHESVIFKILASPERFETSPADKGPGFYASITRAIFPKRFRDDNETF
jgi:hypothetical protein